MGLFDKIKSVLSEVAQPEVGKVAEPVPEVKKKPRAKTTKAQKGPDGIQDPRDKKPRANSKKKKVAEDPDKVKATKLGEPWVKILSMELDPTDPGMGAFELDWNDKFVSNLVRAGYQGKTDSDIVDNWFQTICRNVALETWQQEQADPETRRSNNRRDLGDGRTEVS